MGRFAEADEIAAAVPTEHHQAIDRLGPDLTAVAWAADGIIDPN